MKSCIMNVLVLCALLIAATGLNGDSKSLEKAPQDDDSCPLNLTKSSLSPLVTRCINPNPGTGSLTESCLKTMINTVYVVFGNFSPKTTILTTPDTTLIMYKSGNGTHAEEKFLNTNKGNLASFPRLWISNSPCTTCAKKLVTAYKNETIMRPVLYAGHFYMGTAGKEASLQCLANMVMNGFTLRAFDWNTYRGLVNVIACQNDINTATVNANFTDKMNQMTNTINTVYAYNASGKTNCP